MKSLRSEERVDSLKISGALFVKLDGVFEPAVALCHSSRYAFLRLAPGLTRPHLSFCDCVHRHGRRSGRR